MIKDPGEMTLLPRKSDAIKQANERAKATGQPVRPRLRWTYIDGLGNRVRDEIEAKRGETWDDIYARANEQRKRTLGQILRPETKAETITLFELLDQYLDCRKNIERSTRDLYEYYVRTLHACFDEKDVLLADLDVTDVNAAFSVERPSAKNALKFLRWALDWARDTGKLLGPNPAKRAELPEVKPKRKRRAMTDEHLTALLRHPWDTYMRAFFVLLIYGAFRIGEILALTWDDIGTWKGTDIAMLRLERQQTRYGVKCKLKARKEDEPRFLTLTPFIVTLLDAHKTAQRKAGYNGPLLFPSYEGGVWERNNFRQRIYCDALFQVGLGKRVREPRKGDPGIEATYVPHEMRHTALTLREALGVNPYMMDEVGHAPPGISKVHAGYVHLSPETRLEESAKVSRTLQKLLLSGGKAGKTIESAGRKLSA